jgi:hypothetical protein
MDSNPQDFWNFPAAIACRKSFLMLAASFRVGIAFMRFNSAFRFFSIVRLP